MNIPNIFSNLAKKLNEAFNLYAWEDSQDHALKILNEELSPVVINATAMAENISLMAEIEKLSEEWMQLITQNGHKDRDCHFYVETIFSYGKPPVFVAAHHGYVAREFRIECKSYNEAARTLVGFLNVSIANERQVQAA